MNCSKALLIDAFWADNRYFPSEISPDSPEGKILYSGYKGTATHLGWMDMVQLRNLVKRDNISHLILRNLDLLGKVIIANKNVLNICNAYMCDSYLIHYVPESRILKQCKPIYNTSLVGSWNISDDDDEIPISAQNYIKYLLINTNVQSVTYSTNKATVTAYYSNGKPKLHSEKFE